MGNEEGSEDTTDDKSINICILNNEKLTKRRCTWTLARIPSDAQVELFHLSHRVFASRFHVANITPSNKHLCTMAANIIRPSFSADRRPLGTSFTLNCAISDRPVAPKAAVAAS